VSAVERMQAAIEKLEALKAASTPGPWRLTRAQHVTHAIYGEQPGQEVIGATPRYGGLWSADDGELIVTLHRTIDAQLEVLRSAADFLTNAEREWPAPIWDRHPELRDRLEGLLRFEVALADAILGGTQ